MAMKPALGVWSSGGPMHTHARG